MMILQYTRSPQPHRGFRGTILHGTVSIANVTGARGALGALRVGGHGICTMTRRAADRFSGSIVVNCVSFARKIDERSGLLPHFRDFSIPATHYTPPPQHGTIRGRFTWRIPDAAATPCLVLS